MPKIDDDQYWLLTSFIQLRTKLEAICRTCDGIKLLKHKGEPLASDQDGKKKRLKPTSNFVHKKDKESRGKTRELSKKFCKRCQDYGGA